MARGPVGGIVTREEFNLIRRTEQIIDRHLEEQDIPGELFKNGKRILSFTLPDNFPKNLEPRLVDAYRQCGWQTVYTDQSTTTVGEHFARHIVFNKF